jgi:hypothetical protein
MRLLNPARHIAQAAPMLEREARSDHSSSDSLATSEEVRPGQVTQESGLSSDGKLLPRPTERLDFVKPLDRFERPRRFELLYSMIGGL